MEWERPSRMWGGAAAQVLLLLLQLKVTARLRLYSLPGQCRTSPAQTGLGWAGRSTSPVIIRQSRLHSIGMNSPK